jgi:hypothetical protein
MWWDQAAHISEPITLHKPFASPLFPGQYPQADVTVWLYAFPININGLPKRLKTRAAASRFIVVANTYGLSAYSELRGAAGPERAVPSTLR